MHVPPVSTNSGDSCEPLPTILLVEDDEAVRRLAQIILEDEGYIVLVAVDASDGLQQALSYPHRIDALVTDVVLPGLSGKDLAESVSTTRPEIKVLFLSGYMDDMLDNYGVTAADGRFLQKPYTPGMLVREVQEMLLCGVPTGGA